MLKVLLALLIIFFATGCGRTISQEAVEQARVAIEFGDYSRGSLLLVMGCDDLHEQSVNLLHMVNYKHQNDLLGMVRAWTEIYTIEASEDFVRDAAYELLSTALGNEPSAEGQ